MHTSISEQGLQQGLQIRTMPYEVYRVGHMEAASPAELEADIVIPVS